MDAHVSGKRVGSQLRRSGHDVRAVDEERELEGLADSDLLELSATDNRVLVTFNVRDFVPLIVEHASMGRTHAGVILVPGSVRHEAFSLIATSIDRALQGSTQAEWIDRVEWLRRV